MHRMKDDSPPTSSRQSDKSTWTTRLPVLARFLTLLVGEAVSLFQFGAARDSAESEGTSGPLKAERGREPNEPPALGSHFSWATWVLDTLVVLESTHFQTGRPTIGHSEAENASIGSERRSIKTMPRDYEGIVDDDVNPVLFAVASARSPRAFAAALCAANGSNLDEAARTSAYFLCSRMLNLSQVVSATSSRSVQDHNETESSCEPTSATERLHHKTIRPPVLTKDGYVLTSQERALAKVFSARLRTELSSQSSASSLLQSQLELLAQWELRRSCVGVERESLANCTRCLHEGQGSELYKVGADNTLLRDTWDRSGRGWIDSWDVATTDLAGVEGGGEGFEIASAQATRPVEPRRPGTAESDASALSAPLLPGKLASANKPLLRIEAASPHFITMSWGGWLDSDHGPQLQVGIGSDGVAYPVALNKAVGASDLTQALRSKLKHVAGQRRERGSSLVLKVRTAIVGGGVS